MDVLPVPFFPIIKFILSDKFSNLRFSNNLKFINSKFSGIETGFSEKSKTCKLVSSSISFGAGLINENVPNPPKNKPIIKHNIIVLNFLLSLFFVVINFSSSISSVFGNLYSNLFLSLLSLSILSFTIFLFVTFISFSILDIILCLNTFPKE